MKAALIPTWLQEFEKEREVKKLGVVTISSELLLAALHLEGRIFDVRIDHFRGGNIELVMGGPTMPDCPEGGYPITIYFKDL